MSSLETNRDGKLIMVMGVQRSGTTALLETLGQDPALRVENESEDGPFYKDFFLRPETELRERIQRIRRRILLKPISETLRRSVDSVLMEFEAHRPQAAWIFRDPVDVWNSWRTTFSAPAENLDDWLDEWNGRNQMVLDSLRGPYAPQIAIVRYGDLISESSPMERLCQFLGVQPGADLFEQRSPRSDRHVLSDGDHRKIRDRTREVFDQLQDRRLGAANGR